ncbi:methyltransferase family protein [Kribbella sp. CA-247076]|uniref:methyltransferase family protein n=1 Tax=Kribbella sp. CA-247076 TaxID=3239941 RepID=UPI003D8AACB6
MAGGRHTIAKLTNVPIPEAVLAGIAVGCALEQVRPWRLKRRQAAGWSAVIAGSVIVTAAVSAAGRTTLAQPDTLVTTGVYGVSRNPMYVGTTLLHLGIGLTTRSGWILATLPLTSAAIHHGVLAEERRLSEQFPEEFRQYCGAVRRYL